MCGCVDKWMDGLANGWMVSQLMSVIILKRNIFLLLGYFLYKKLWIKFRLKLCRVFLTSSYNVCREALLHLSALDVCEWNGFLLILGFLLIFVYLRTLFYAVLTNNHRDLMIAQREIAHRNMLFLFSCCCFVWFAFRMWRCFSAFILYDLFLMINFDFSDAFYLYLFIKNLNVWSQSKASILLA